MGSRLAGKVAIVTGAANGMGRAHVRRLAQEGASVLATDVDSAGLEHTVAEANRDGGTVVGLEQDVAIAARWDEIVAEAEQRFGRLDILVNNAGVLILKPVEETTEEEWDLIFRINAKGVFLGTKAAVPALVRAGGGSIVNISSIYGIIGAPSAAAYEASKGAVRVDVRGSSFRMTLPGDKRANKRPNNHAESSKASAATTPNS